MREVFGLGFRVAYDGSAFAGFQIQSHRNSIQAELERALKIFFRQKIRIHFTSRTDAGVHAYDQWIFIPGAWHLFDSLSKIEKKRCLHSINALLPESIRCWEILKLTPSFNPKKSIQWKEYEYWVAWGPVMDPMLTSLTWWVRSPLDISAMKHALVSLKGEHDFSAFMKGASRHSGSTVRTIYKADIRIELSKSISSLRILKFRFRGSGFLHHMIRNIVGTSIEVGRGRIASLEATLKSGDRREAGMRAPAGALRLVRTKARAQDFKIVPSYSVE